MSIIESDLSLHWRNLEISCERLCGEEITSFVFLILILDKTRVNLSTKDLRESQHEQWWMMSSSFRDNDPTVCRGHRHWHPDQGCFGLRDPCSRCYSMKSIWRKICYSGNEWIKLDLLFYRLWFSSIFIFPGFVGSVDHRRLHIFMIEFCNKEVTTIARVASAQNSGLSWRVCLVRFLNLVCFTFCSHLT